MVVIRIQQRSEQPGSFQAILSFDYGPEYPITIRDSFSEEEERWLGWYFEQYLKFPFIEDVRARQAAASITTYGEALFNQVFADRQAYACYYDCRQVGLERVQVEIAGEPPFHALHWEALKDPDLSLPLAIQASMVRQNLRPPPVDIMQRPSPTINLLVVAARPFGKRDASYRAISRPLVEALQQAHMPVQVELLRPGTYRALENHLREITARYGAGYYHIIHFDVHGALLSYPEVAVMEEVRGYGRPKIQPYEGERAFLFLESEQDGISDPVEASQLAELLTQHQVPIAILNACQSAMQPTTSEVSLGSRLAQAGLQVVLAMGYSITVSAATLLMRSLYQHLLADDDLLVAIRRARAELYNAKSRHVYFDQQIDLEDWLLPVVYQNRPVRLDLREFTPQESEAFYARQKKVRHETLRQPRYGFVGRDLDVLRIERLLLTKRNILLLRGMGGAGKTALLEHLRSWWQTTGLAREACYFGYDEHAWTVQEILHIIARQLFDDLQYERDFLLLSPEAQQERLTAKLRAEPHLLILDNLESITGEHLTIRHTLSSNERQALHALLADLIDGKTLVLLGSRSAEEWLAQGTFAENVYELGGLDAEATSTLVNRILMQHHATSYRDDKDLQQLLKVLDGFPLALEVTLANLARRSPGEVLAALRAGDAELDHAANDQSKDLFEQKAMSILRCIEYSYSNLSPQSQQLLICLAPFTSIVDVRLIETYIAHLKQQPGLAMLPFDRWLEVLEQATDWGLFSPDADLPDCLHIQPTLPYFLRHHLRAQEQVALRQAIETAFRLHYDEVSESLGRLLNSRDPQDRRVAKSMAAREYENLVTALHLALAAQVSVYNLYFALSDYLDASQEQSRLLELGQIVLAHLATYPTEKQAGKLGAEFVRISGDVANRQLALKQYAAAEATYQKLLKLIDKVADISQQECDSLKARAYHQLGSVALEQRQWEQAEAYLQQALQIEIEANEHHEQARTYRQLGIMAQQQRQWEQAEVYYQMALQIEIEFNEYHEQAKTYHQLGRVAGEQKQWEKAEAYYKQALPIERRYGDCQSQATTYQELGRVAGEQRRWTQAEAFYKKALQLRIESNDRYGQASIYHQLGMVVEEQRQWEQAEAYYKKALEIYREYNDPEQASIYHQLGMVAEEQKQWEQAEAFYKEALRLKIEFNDRHAQGSTYSQLGVVAMEREQWEQAEAYLQQALQIEIEFNDRYAQISTYHQLGMMAQRQRKWEQAEAYYQQALQIDKKFEDLYNQAKTYGQLGRVAEEQRQWEQACEYYLIALETFVDYDDSRSATIILRSLIRMWRVTGDASLLMTIAAILDKTEEETKAWLEGR